MGSRGKVPGKELPVFELIGKTIVSADYQTPWGVHQIQLTTDEGLYVQWGSGCCCDVATVSAITGELSDLVGKKIEYVGFRRASTYIAEYTIKTADAAIMIQWLGKHPGFVHKAVHFVFQEKQAS